MIEDALHIARVPTRHRELISREIAGCSTLEEMISEARRLVGVLDTTWNL